MSEGFLAGKLSPVLAALLLLAVTACQSAGTGNGQERAVAAISIAPTTAAIEVGQTQAFTAVASDAGGNVVTTNFSWDSSRAEVATVAGGIATGLAEGITEITASAAGVTSNAASLTVNAAANGPPPARDTIAYVHADSNEIRLINPDGTGDRLLWAHGQDDPEGVYEVWSLAWRPDAAELAFASTHENWCSINFADVFVIGADGDGYRRITQAPACAALANYPRGTVRVPVENSSIFGESFTGFLYFQGAPGIQMLSLPPGGSGVVTFENVADFGEGVFQMAAVIEGLYRDYSVGTAVDVQAGSTVTTAPFPVYSPQFTWETRSPTWRADGSKLGYAYGFNSLLGIVPDPLPLDFGAPLLAESAALANIVLYLAYGPTPERANQLLYQGWDAFESNGIYLVAEGSASAGEQLVSYEAIESILGLSWLPDGSGFVYAVTEGDFFAEARSANLFEYDFATGEVTRLTNFTGEFAGHPSVSPDGRRIVFERAAAMEELGDELVDPDLWIVNRDGSGLQLLVERGRAPAWSR